MHKNVYKLGIPNLVLEYKKIKGDKKMRYGQNRNNNSNNRGRHRRIYELTGVPGWVRFGSSPGFAGGGAGRGPCADYLERTGQLDDFLRDISKNNPNYDVWTNAIENTSKSNSAVGKDQLLRRIKDLEEELKYLKKELKNNY